MHMVFPNCNIMTDTGYINTYYPVNFVTKYKATTGHPLTEEQLTYNQAHSIERGKIERFFGILKARFQFLICGYRGPLRHLVRLMKLALCLTSDIIRINQNHFTNEEEARIREIIATDAQHNPLDPFLLVGNDINTTFPEVVVNPITGQHHLVWESVEEERRWSGRTRTIRDPFPTYQNTDQHTENRGSNQTPRGTTRPREDDQLPPSHERRREAPTQAPNQ
jgi:hypothetical protein